MSLIFYGKNFKISSHANNYSNYQALLEDFAKISSCNLSNYKIFNENFVQIDLAENSKPTGNLFLVDSDNMINIKLNGISYKIPSDMTINDFNQISKNQNYIYNQYKIEMFSDEYFTNGSNYFS